MRFQKDSPTKRIIYSGLNLSFVYLVRQTKLKSCKTVMFLKVEKGFNPTLFVLLPLKDNNPVLNITLI